MKKKKQTIIPPEGGWKPNTYYLVEAAFSETNPIYGYIFFTGYLDDNGTPSQYNFFCLYAEDLDISNVYYMRAIKELINSAQLYEVPNLRKLPIEKLST